AGYEERDRAAARVADIAADAAHKDRVLAGGVLGHGKVVALGIVHHLHAGSRLHEVAHLLGGDEALALEVDGDRVGAQHGHAHAGGGNADGVIAVDLVRLAHD